MLAYKVFNLDWECQPDSKSAPFKFEVGKTYIHSGPIKICEKGFHACIKLIDCFQYYSFNPKNKVALVDCGGEIQKHDRDSKVCCSEIAIVEEITWHDVLDMCNTGKQNSGYSNSGDRNSGYSNSGHWNSGDRNSGDMNSGYRNSGDMNSGDMNSGNSNSGDMNSGQYNACSNESGWFNTCPEFINVFNKPCKRSVFDNARKPFFDLDLMIWIALSDMTEEENIEYPNAETTGGYLKTITYKEAWKIAWAKSDDLEKERLYNLPNFDWRVFTEIAGIEEK